MLLGRSCFVVGARWTRWFAACMLGGAVCVGFGATGARAQQSSPVRALTAEEERVVSALPVVPSRLNRAYALVTKPTRRIKAVYTFTVSAPKLRALSWVLLAPKPPDLPGQKIVRVSSTPAGVTISELSPLRQKVLRAKIHAKTEKQRTGVTLAVDIEASLFSRMLISRRKAPTAGTARALTELDRKLALRPTSQFDYTSEAVQVWLAKYALKRAAREGEVDFARRVFQVIVRNYRFHYVDKQNRVASYVCTVGKTDCGGMAGLFVTALRSQGIAARMLAGRWARSATPDEKVGEVTYFQEHIKAEFFAREIGWVPVDVALGVLRDRSPGKLRYFGYDGGNFLTLHLDNDLKCDTLYMGLKTSALLQTASWWAIGTGDFNDVTVTEDWQVK